MIMRTVVVTEGSFKDLWAQAVTGSEIDFDVDSTLQQCRDTLKNRAPDLVCIVDAGSLIFHVMRKDKGGQQTRECIGFHPYSQWFGSPLGPIIRRGDRYLLVVVKETPMPTAMPVIRPFDGTADAVAELTTRGPGG